MDDRAPFDHRQLHRNRNRATWTLHRVAPILDDLAQRLLDRLDDVTRRFAFALDLGGRGVIAPALRARGIVPVSYVLSPAQIRLESGLVLCGHEEALPFAEASFDLVVASLSLHWANDLPGALVQIRRVLRPDGLLLASFPVLGTLDTLRQTLTATEAALTGGVSPRVAPFADLRDLAGLMQRAGFALPVADVEDITLLYTEPMQLLRDLRDAGEANAMRLRDRRIPHRALFPAALAALPDQNGRTRALLRLGIVTGWTG